MQPKLIIYDPPMCCSSGICGPNPDPILIEFQNTVAELKKMGLNIERRMIIHCAEDLKNNIELSKLIKEKQFQALPVTIINGVIVKSGAYPSLEELKQFIEAAQHKE
jgi:hypothetical protein